MYISRKYILYVPRLLILAYMSGKIGKGEIGRGNSFNFSSYLEVEAMPNVFKFIRLMGLMGYIKINVPMSKIENEWNDNCREYRHKYLGRLEDKPGRSSNFCKERIKEAIDKAYKPQENWGEQDLWKYMDDLKKELKI